MQIQCKLCGMPLTGEGSDANKLQSILFGEKEGYKVCCKCHQEVDESSTTDQNYRRRWRRHMAKLKTEKTK